MKAIIVNRKINDDNFKCNDEVEIIANNRKLLDGRSIKQALKLKSDEMAIRKITNDDSFVITKCKKDDIKIKD